MIDLPILAKLKEGDAKSSLNREGQKGPVFMGEGGWSEEVGNFPLRYMN